MGISALTSASHPGMSAMAAGIRAQWKAQNLATALDTFEMLDPEVGQALKALADEGHAVALGGIAIAKEAMLGSLFDAMA